MRVGCEDSSFLRLISITGQAIRSRADQWLKRHDLTIEQFQVLKEMAQDVGQTQRSLSTATAKSPANITRILDRLEKKKRIVRKRNPDDRRSSLVFLTEDGAKIRCDVEHNFHGLSRSLLAGVDAASRDQAYEVLQAVMKNIENLS